MSDGMIVDTGNAVTVWTETTRWDGNNNVSVVTGSQWDHQRLYKTRRGRYWLEYWGQWQGSKPHAEWIDNHEAARWLLHCEHELPEDLQALAGELIE
jgi:hypothetical protein